MAEGLPNADGLVYWQHRVANWIHHRTTQGFVVGLTPRFINLDELQRLVDFTAWTGCKQGFQLRYRYHLSISKLYYKYCVSLTL